jgi:ribosomal protein S9
MIVPFTLCSTAGMFDVYCTVKGGGISGRCC